MVRQGDVLTENFRPGTMDRLGFSYEELSKLNPRLIYASCTGFGQTGPLRTFPAYDSIIQATTGLMSMTGFPDGPPTRCGASISDLVAGTLMFSGIGTRGSSPLARFENEDLERKLYEYAELLAAEAARHPFHVVARELPVSSTLGGLTIHGRVDRVDRLTTGELVIRDYKAGRTHGALGGALRRAFERIDAGEQLYGDAPKGLNLQTLLYIPGVEAHLGAPVRAIEYVYFRGKGSEDSAVLFERTQIVDDEGAGDGDDVLTRADVDRARLQIAARIALLCSDGEMTAFTTTVDEQLCAFCDFERICPGAGSIPR
jgi:hypothetical protein